MLARLTVPIAIPVLALVLACAPASAPASALAPGEPAGGAAPTQPTAPKKGGVLFLASPQAPETLMPYKGASIAEKVAFNGVYEGLVNWKFTPDLEVNEDYRSTFATAPALAEKWELLSDNRTHIFTLRKEARWHDGQPVTFDDVLFSYGLLMDPQNGYRGRTSLRDVETLEKVGPDQLKIVIKAPAAEFLAGLGPADNGLYILPKHKADSLSREVVGSGPFKMKSADLKAKIVYARNDDWSGPEGPYLDGAEIIFGLDTSARLAAMAARKIDFYTVSDRKQLDPIVRAAPDLKVLTFWNSDGTHLYFRIDRKPYDDQRVRKAIDLVVDRQAMIKALYGGDAVINPPAGLGHKKNWGIPQEELQKLPGYRQPKDADVADARRLLAEAGYPSGFKTTLYSSAAMTGIPVIFEAVAGQVRAVGIDMTVQAEERAVYARRQNEGDYEAHFAVAAGDLPNARLTAYFHSSGALNPSIRDPKLDELIERQGRTLDVAQRGRIHAEIQRLIHENSYAVPTIDPAWLVAVQPWVRNVTLNRTASAYPMDWSKVWFDLEKIPPR